MCKRGNPATPTNTLAHFCSKKGGSKMSKCSILECTLPFAAFCLLAKKEKKRQRQHFFANGKKSVALGGNKAVLYFLLKYVGEKKICAKKGGRSDVGKAKKHPYLPNTGTRLWGMEESPPYPKKYWLTDPRAGIAADICTPFTQ